MQEERGPRVRNNALSNPHNINVTWKPRVDPSTTFCARFSNSEIYLPFKNSTLNSTIMMKTLRESETRENIFFPVMPRHAQPTRIISPGNFLSLEYLSDPTLDRIYEESNHCILNQCFPLSG